MSRPQAVLARLCSLLFVTLAFVIAIAAPASAHATLTSTTPTDGSVVHGPVTSVTVTFDESVGVSPGSLRIYDPKGARVDDGPPAQSNGGTTVKVSLRPNLGPGTYTAAWHVVSSDSHPVSGAFTFSIGHPSSHISAASIQSHGGLRIQIIYGVVRALGFVGFCVFAGGVAFVLGCWPAGGADPRARRLLAFGWGLCLGAGILSLLLQGTYASNHGFGGMVDTTLLKRTLHSRLGVCLLARIALLLAAGVVSYLVLERWPRTSRLRDPARIAGWAVALAAVAATWSLAGHASVGRYVPLAVASDVIHLGAAVLWVGGLCMLAGTTLRGLNVRLAWETVSAFSPLALACVAVLIVTGSFQTLRDTGHWAALFETTYGLLILAKIVGLVLLMGLGLVARNAIDRFFNDQAHVDPTRDTPISVLARLRRGVAIEVGIAVVVLGLTAVLVNTATGREQYTPVASASEAFDTGNAKGNVHVVVTPATLGPQTVHLTVTDSHGHPYQPAEIDASLTLPSQGIGPLDLHVMSDGGGKYHTHAVPVGIAGVWTVSVLIRSDDFDETTVTASATIR
jgi:copper transport protein